MNDQRAILERNPQPMGISKGDNEKLNHKLVINLNITKEWLMRKMENQRLIKLPPCNRKKRQCFNNNKAHRKSSRNATQWKPGSFESCNPTATNNNRRTAGTYI